MREIRLYGSEGGGTELNRSSLPLSRAEKGIEVTPEEASLMATAASIIVSAV